jgi:hypothetical protein
LFATPKLLWKVSVILALGSIISLSGLVLGAMLVVLPPMAPVGAIGILVAILICVMPELKSVPERLLRRAFFAALVVEICVPVYYTVQIAGLPWISIRRIFIFALISLLFLTVGGSNKARSRTTQILSDNKILSVCIVGFLAIATLSLLTARNNAASAIAYLEILVEWYFPFFACLLVIRSDEDIILFLKIVCIAFMIDAMIGIVEFVSERRIMISMIPQGLLETMMESNPIFATMLNSDPRRNGHYRASSIYIVPLSFGELAAMVAPLGAYFIIHRQKLSDLALGIAVVVSAILTLFVSGSRGGSVGFLISMPLLVGLWIMRLSRQHPRSLVSALGALLALLGFSATMAAVFLWKRLSNIVLGGGDSQGSTSARLLQWEAAKPHILSNPITGHGVGGAPALVGWTPPGGEVTLDSYLITLLVETGVPGFCLFFGAILLAAWTLARIYVTDLNRRNTLGAAMAASFVAFGAYRLVLSQRENQTLFFLLLAVSLVFIQGCSPSPVVAGRGGDPARPAETKLTSRRNARDAPEEGILR